MRVGCSHQAALGRKLHGWVTDMTARAGRRGAGAAAVLTAALVLAGGQTASATGGEVGGSGDRYVLSNSFSSASDFSVRYGRASDEVYVGDWDGDGADTLAVRRGATFHVSNSLAGGDADHTFTYGRAGDTVLVGDWDGDGADTLAVRRGNAYHVRNSLTGGNAEDAFRYGRADDTVLVGDWDGDREDTFAVRRGSGYHVRNSLTGGDADTLVRYGRADDTVLVGDWDGDDDDTLTIRRGVDYHISNELRGGGADRVVTYGRAYHTALAGDWDGDGDDTFGGRRGVPYRATAELALAAAVALDEERLGYYASPSATEWLMYAFGEFYTVEGPFAVGDCVIATSNARSCGISAEDFPAYVGFMRVVNAPDGSWTVDDYDIVMDWTPAGGR